MKSILEQFACGNLETEQHFFAPGSVYAKTFDKMVHHEEELLALLNESEKQTFTAFSDAQYDLNTLHSLDRFLRGYKLGALMTMEVFLSKDELINGK